MKKILKISLIIAILALGLAGCNNETSTDGEGGEVIAKYEGGVVNEKEFNEYLNIRKFFSPKLEEDLKDQEVKKQLLNQFIAEKYLLDKAKSDKSYEEEAQKLVDYFKQQVTQTLGSEEEYGKKLEELNLAEEDLLQYLTRFFRIQDYFVKKRYDENKEEFTVATVSHILISIDENRTEAEAKERAEEVLSKLNAGGDFAALAKEYSDDPGSKDNGGTYEDAPVAYWVEEFKEAAVTLPIDEISGLVKTTHGYHIMKVSERSVPVADEIDEEIKNLIYSEEYTDFLYNQLPDLIEETNLPK